MGEREKTRKNNRKREKEEKGKREKKTAVEKITFWGRGRSAGLGGTHKGMGILGHTL